MHLVDNLLPGQLNVGLHSEPGAHGKPQDVGVRHFGGSNVNLAGIVDLLVESLVDGVTGLQSEADQPQLGRKGKLEPVVLFDEVRKIFGKFDLGQIE